MSNNYSGLTRRPDDCEVTKTVRAALHATDLWPSEDDVIGIVISLYEDFPELRKHKSQEIPTDD